MWAATIDSLPNPNLSRSFYDLRHIQVDGLLTLSAFSMQPKSRRTSAMEMENRKTAVATSFLLIVKAHIPPLKLT